MMLCPELPGLRSTIHVHTSRTRVRSCAPLPAQRPPRPAHQKMLGFLASANVPPTFRLDANSASILPVSASYSPKQIVSKPSSYDSCQASFVTPSAVTAQRPLLILYEPSTPSRPCPEMRPSAVKRRCTRTAWSPSSLSSLAPQYSPLSFAWSPLGAAWATSSPSQSSNS